MKRCPEKMAAIAAERRKQRFEVVPPTPENDQFYWCIRRPDGLICCGHWFSEEAAQLQADKWNNRKTSWDVTE